MCLLIFNNSVVFAEDVVYGDADNNGVLTANDSALMLYKLLNDDYVLPGENSGNDYIEITDVDNDGVLTANDCALVLRKVLNSGFVFPREEETENPAEETTEVTTEEVTESTTEVTTEETTETTTETVTEETTETTTEDSLNISINIGNSTFTAELYDNESAKAFMDMLPVTVTMNELNGNEKYYYFDETFPTNTQSVGYINAGDLMLYGNNCLVLFYDSFSTSYRYTPLGHIDNPEDLAETVGSGNVTVTFTK
ncbi:MAG: hypothetical protein LUH47_02080 [Clostridiales bacterium]|nr:hypothetical protein [Clostridiales bacterium]